MNKITDIRVTKTNIAIRKAFIEIMEEEGFSKLNVKKIIDRAKINRSTFYAHYMDKYDLLEKIEDQFLNGLKDIEIPVPEEVIIEKSFSTEYFLTHVEFVISYLKENGKLMTLLMSDKGDPAFSNKLNEVLKQIWLDKKITDKLSIPQNYAIAAVTGMITSVIVEWVKSDFKESEKEFEQIVIKIIKDIPRNILI
ncbi:TetR/AcrR family transcriptional regulator C-terminal domain-containing protein [uncultured Intestinibacter sp.]|uniref:TetR/AcrR family transcriptional regulator n=1 Tax=uncultured Intestinibacter sp. TaxID=1505659 RepID=UPI0027DD59B9|nr:TetR/AcrR family transcriptional regulator C-terminal domain-containing protein [uncultured Intestinibacter sp.]